MSVSAPPPTLLNEYLTPEHAAYLTRHGNLPPAVRAELASTLRQTLAAYAAYIPSRLVARQLHTPRPGQTHGEFWEGSLLFADLSGFTALSEQLSVLGRQGAEEISGIVNRLFAMLVDEVSTHEGILLKFGGDALTAFFDEETLGPLHATAASRAALAMQERMEAFAAVPTRLGTFRLQMRVGVHSGRVFAAEVGDHSHIELVITGKGVNLVAQAQELAAPGEVVVSNQTADLLEEADLLPHGTVFQRILALPPLALPTPTVAFFDADMRSDLPTLMRLAEQIATIRPYLMRGLPRRFLDTTTTELGEFRPVSVLFANFHDFSALLDSMDGTHGTHRLNVDPTRAAEVLNAYYRRTQEVVHRYDGIVNKVDMATHGDKMMVLFGAPTAHEDDPLRVVHCALDLEAALAAANAEIADLLGLPLASRKAPLLAQRIGINTGTVFAGRVGGAQRYEYTVMGPAVNLSARLMAKAADTMILISPATRQAVEHLVAVADHPPLRLKGLPQPITPGIVTGRERSNPEAPSSVATALHTALLVGRDDELALLLRQAVAALSGTGRVIALVGDAGIGKTRLGSELIKQLALLEAEPGTALAAHGFVLVSGDCQSYEQNMPYMALRTPLRQLLDLANGDTGEPTAGEPIGTLDVLEDAVERLAPSLLRFSPLLGQVLGIAVPETPLTRSLTAEQQHDRLQELLLALFLGAASSTPLILALEDMQWADASTLELVQRLAQASDQTPLLLLLNYRPSPPIHEAWADVPATTRLELRELSTSKSRALLTALLNADPPADLYDLLERTQGNPFYIEELVRTLVLEGILSRARDGTWYLTRPLDEVAIPGSIEGLIMARLDRLGEDQYNLVQLASVIGRRFQHSVLAGIYTDTAALDQTLRDLIGSEIVQPDAQESQESYLFRHALLRDVAYESILYARRRELHLRVAQRLEALTASDTQERQNALALLARHYLLAEVWQPAFAFHLEAAHQARQRYANQEALALYATALDITASLPPPDDATAHTHTLVDIHEQRGTIHALLGNADDAVADYLEALALLATCEAGERECRMRLHRLIASVESQSSNYDMAFQWLHQGMQLANDDTQAELARSYLLGAKIHYRQGEMTTALEWATHSLELAEQVGNTIDQAQALRLKGVIQSEIGEIPQSIQALERACELWNTVTDDMNGLSRILNDLGAVYQESGRWKESTDCYEQALEISETISDAVGIADTSNNMAFVLVGLGELERANDLYIYSRQRYQQIGSAWGMALTDSNRGEVLLLQGQYRAALQLFQQSIETFERIKSRTFIPEAYRRMAEALLHLGQHVQAIQYAQQASVLALELGITIEDAGAQRVLGHIAFLQGNITTAQQHLDLSYDMLKETDAPYELAKVLFLQAQVALASHQSATAEDLLQQAVQRFATLEARRDVAAVQALATEHRLSLDGLS